MGHQTHHKLQPRKLKIQVSSGAGWGTTLLKGRGGPDGQWAKRAPALCPGIAAYEAVLAGA